MEGMNEIIKLLADIVGKVNKNNELLVSNTAMLTKLEKQIKSIPSGGGGGGGGGGLDLDSMGDDLKRTVNDLQKGFQIMEINRALTEVRELMSYISEAPAVQQGQLKASGKAPIPIASAGPKADQGEPEEEKKDTGHLLKPSDLFG